MTKEFFDRLRERLLATGASQTVIGNATHIDQAALSRFISGQQRTLRADAIIRLVHWLGGSINLGPAERVPEPMDDYVLVPKVSAVAGAGASLETGGDVLGLYAFRREFLQREGISSKHAVMMLVSGDSMEPLLRHGDTVLVDESANVPLDGHIFVVRLGGELMVKRLQKTGQGWNICSLNPGYGSIPVGGEQEDFQVYGRVRWFGRVV